MVDQGHLDMLKQSVSTWNKYRRKHPEIQPDLREQTSTRCHLWEQTYVERTFNGLIFTRLI